MRLKKILVGVALLAAGFIWGSQLPITAQAATDKIADVLSGAPKGVTIDSNYFSVGSISGNSAAVEDTGQGSNEAVKLTDSTGEIGTIWTSNLAEMDLNEPQTASMWMYFGNGSTSSSGDGMAFVMQNDPRGTGAVATNASGEPASGETLGVWGDDQRTDFSQAPNLETIAGSAIQDSWALEFDTYVNSDVADATLLGNKASQFDMDLSGYPHIASNYPGDSNSYSSVTKSESVTTTTTDFFGVKHSSTKSVPYYYTKLTHNGVLKDFNIMADGNWHHVTLHWTPAPSGSTVGQMTYSYNDKNASTGAPVTSGSSDPKYYAPQTVDVDTSKLGVGSDGLIRWGFTGSTGDNSENNVVVFEQVPELVNSSATSTLTDKTQSDKTISSSSDTVNSGDRMSLKYNLSYDSGKASWQDIVAKLNLPKNILYDSTAKITYANGDEQDITGLTTGDLTGQSVNSTLNDKLNADNKTATITFTGIASATTATTVAATNNRFEGTTAITQAQVTGFTVNPVSGSATMALTGDNLTNSTNGAETLTSAKDVPVTGKITYLNATMPSNSKITLHPELNGTELPTTTLSDSDTAGTFTYTIPADKLIVGQVNQLELYATDSNGLSTNDVGYAVTLNSGDLDLSVSSDATFNADNPRKLTGTAMTFAPDSNWSVKVSDTFTAGSEWKLTASASPITETSGSQLRGDLVYVESDGTSESLLSGSADIMTRTTTSNDDVTNISDTWDDSHGLFLKTDADVTQGTYSSEIKWDLENVPN